jgi:hypothetical protein
MNMTDEAKPGCAVCDPQGHPPMSRDDIEAELRAAADGQFQIARHGHGWALIAKTAFWNEDPPDEHDGPVVLYAGLQSKEAAIVALDAAMKSYLNTRFHDPISLEYIGDDPVTELNAIGRILGVLECSQTHRRPV